MSRCSSLQAISDQILQLTKLTKIDASQSGLVSMDLDIWNMAALRTLDLSGCASLVALPVEIDTADGLSVIGANDVSRYHVKASIWESLQRRCCAICFRQFGLDVPRLKICCRCRKDFYCSVECQRADWEKHRPVCREYRRTCDVCGLKAGACDRPFPTCHCGKRRYCGEECQAKDWAARHAKTCKSGYLYLDG